ncbi:unnamed protein product [Cercospora beticola]|nr:unnamed protein product [Cercospora beticola]
MPLHHQQPLSTRELSQETSDQHQSAACEEYGDSFFKELLEAAGVSDTECEGSREPATGNSVTLGESVDPGTNHADRRDSLLTTDELKIELTAASVVFGTYELLEQILLQADNGTILRLQRTNKTWDHVINRSHALQRKLFFQAEPPQPDTSNEVIRWNPLFPHRVSQCEIGRDCRHSSGEIVICVRRPLHTRFLTRIAMRVYPIKHWRNGSWRRMLLCQGAKFTDRLSFHRCPWGLRNVEKDVRVVMAEVKAIVEESCDKHRQYFRQ